MPRPYGEWHYIRGDFYRLDDISGFKVRSSRQRKQWNGLIVAKEIYETRPQQDFVKGRVDEQAVPNPRPRPSRDTFVLGNAYTTEDASQFYTAEDGISIYVPEF